ncbi:motility protein A [Virgisporangium aliadipatigenens]|uniref:Motility protein A n=1 Tax=Virgisporangium aliadipatigenens TaxID=741659 RepID=A0A8J3YQM4_9ACTN|nr:motility protein A [Virgisporangium aliadipatigenens]GIJ48667.1 motility protein A [Virgisporangium aliadipatigenens]
MDPASLIGVALAFGSVFLLIILEGGSIGSIFLIPPLILIFGGTIGVTMAGGYMKDAVNIGKIMVRAFTTKVTPPDALVEQIVKLAERARREGLLALEDAMKDVEDPFLKKGLQLAIDGTDPEELADILEAEVKAKKNADKFAAKTFADMGAFSPTIGIVGTTLGLINALENLAQPEKLGHLIASAFVATLWGLLSANMIFLPISNKMKRVSEIESGLMEMVVAGIINIQAGANPRLVAQKLRSLLPPGSEPAEEKKAA